MDLTQYLPLIQTWYAVLGMCMLIGGLTFAMLVDVVDEIESYMVGAIGGALIWLSGGILIWIVKAIFPHVPISINVIGPVTAVVCTLVAGIFSLKLLQIVVRALTKSLHRCLVACIGETRVSKVREFIRERERQREIKIKELREKRRMSGLCPNCGGPLHPYTRYWRYSSGASGSCEEMRCPRCQGTDVMR